MAGTAAADGDLLDLFDRAGVAGPGLKAYHLGNSESEWRWGTEERKGGDESTVFVVPTFPQPVSDFPLSLKWLLTNPGEQMWVKHEGVENNSASNNATIVTAGKHKQYLIVFQSRKLHPLLKMP